MHIRSVFVNELSDLTQSLTSESTVAKKKLSIHYSIRLDLIT